MRNQAEVAVISKSLRDPRSIITAAAGEALLNPRTCAGTALLDRSNFQIEFVVSFSEVRVKANRWSLPQWLDATVESLSYVIADALTYHTPVNLNAAKYAIELLPALMTDESLPPAVSLWDQGGFAFQWYDVDVSLFVPQPTQAFLECNGNRYVWVADDPPEEVSSLREKIPNASSQDWLASAKPKITEFSGLKAGWDQEHAKQIMPTTITAALKLAELLATLTSQTPKIVPLSEGEIQFEWRRGRKLLALEVESPTSVHYLKWDPTTKTEDEDAISISDRTEIAKLLIWFEGSQEHATTPTKPSQG
jgi:hypothetical protein